MTETTVNTVKERNFFMTHSGVLSLSDGIEGASIGLVGRIGEGMAEYDIKEVRGILTLIAHAAWCISNFVEQMESNEAGGHHE